LDFDSFIQVTGNLTSDNVTAERIRSITHRPVDCVIPDDEKQNKDYNQKDPFVLSSLLYGQNVVFASIYPAAPSLVSVLAG
jgi:hypothetical protein